MNRAGARRIRTRRALGDPREEGGQLLMLAGIVLTISFILTALTLSQVSAMEREAAARTSSPILGEWRFLHDRLGPNLDTAIGAETDNPTFLQTILPTVQATFRSVFAEKGYDLVLRAAADAGVAPTGHEAQLVNSGQTHYDAWSWDGAVRFDHPIPAASPHNSLTDGVIWHDTCPISGGVGGKCIVGVYIYVKMTDGTSSIEESILFAINQP